MSFTLEKGLIVNDKAITFNFNPQIKQARFEEKIYDFLYELGNDDPFIIEESNNLKRNEVWTISSPKDIKRRFKFQRDIYRNLSYIEKQSSMFFTPPFIFTNEDVTSISMLYQLFKTKKMDISNLNLSVELNYGGKTYRLLLDEKPIDVMLKGDGVETYEILKSRISIRIKAFILSKAKLLNSDEVQNQIEQLKPTVDLKLSNDTGKADVIYEVFKD